MAEQKPKPKLPPKVTLEESLKRLNSQLSIAKNAGCRESIKMLQSMIKRLEVGK